MDSTLVKRTHIIIAKNLEFIKNQVLRACSQGDRLVGKDHRSSPTATHKEDNQKINHALTSSHNGTPYVHAWESQTLTQVSLKFTTTLLA